MAEKETTRQTQSRTTRGAEDEMGGVVDHDDANAEDLHATLTRKIEEQSQRIEELEALLLDLSTRVADDRGFGVCPACHGPVEKVHRWFGTNTIECRRCGEVFHEY